MSDTEHLLEKIEEAVIEHGGDLGGWTRRTDGKLQIFDGRITLRAEFHDCTRPISGSVIHAHVFHTLHDHDDQVLDACLFGIGDDDETAIGQIVGIWIMSVAGPIRSFLDGHPICMTCQAGVENGDPNEGFTPDDFGFREAGNALGLRAYVGPAATRGDSAESTEDSIDSGKPWFRYAATSAAPRRVHIAKATVMYSGEEGWSRELEVDGHDVSFRDTDWPADPHGDKFFYATRYAVFEFPRNSAEIHRRKDLEKTIQYFAEHFAKYESVDDLMRHMADNGFEEEMIFEAEAFSTIAFGRMLFEGHGVQYPMTVIRARKNGSVEPNAPLLSRPSYTRARAMEPWLRESLSDEDFQALCLYNAESHGILQAIEAMGENLDLASLKLYPCVVPDWGVSEATMTQAMDKLQMMIDAEKKHRNAANSTDSMQKKPWWKFWA